MCMCTINFDDKTHSRFYMGCYFVKDYLVHCVYLRFIRSLICTSCILLLRRFWLQGLNEILEQIHIINQFP